MPLRDIVTSIDIERNEGSLRYAGPAIRNKIANCQARNKVKIP